MERTAIGTIVMSRVKYADRHSYPQGFITVFTADGDYLTLDVDAYTEFETLDEEARVLVTCELLEGTGVWTARKVRRLFETKAQEQESSGTWES